MDSFVLRVILSFIVGGIYISGVVWTSEKFGTKIGGILAGVPNTILISIIFISLTSGDRASHQATLILPSVFLATLTFNYIFGKNISRQPVAAFLSAFIVWFAISWVLVKLKIDSIVLNSLIGVASMSGLWYVTRGYPKNLKAKSVANLTDHILRAIFAGAVIATAVVTAHQASPAWGGVFALFPAGSVSMFFILNRAHGSDFINSVIHRMSLSVGSALSFAVIFYLLILHLGLLLSLVFGMAVAIFYALALDKLTA